MMLKGGFVAKDDEFHAGTSHGDIHATEVGEETNLPVVVAAHKADEDDVAFLSLKAIDGVDADDLTERTELLTLADLLTEILRLHLIRGDDAHIEPFGKETLFSDFFYVILECGKHKFCFRLVDASMIFTDELFGEIKFRRPTPRPPYREGAVSLLVSLFIGRDFTPSL